jgi:uncharacterized protein (DUF3084 family)
MGFLPNFSMTTSALVLILSILILGGGIAALGDRIGTRVGKARLSLFNLRPRQTAIVVTLLTGVTIAASTLTILFASSAQLRTGIFELDQIQKRLRIAREDLDRVTNQKSQVEGELTTTLAQKTQVELELSRTKTEKADAQKRLDATNKSLKVAVAKQALSSRQIGALSTDIRKLLGERSELIKQRDRVKADILALKSVNNQLQGQNSQLKGENNQLQASNNQLQTSNNQLQASNTQLQARNSELQARNSELEKQLADQTQQISEKTKQIVEQTIKLSDQKQQLEEQEKQIAKQEKERVFLKQEVAALEQYYRSYQLLREREVSLVRGQVLAAGIVRILDPTAARQAVDQLLSEANRKAIEANQINNSNGNERVVQITQKDVEELLSKIKDGQDYIVRILSAGNYVKGEKQVQVFADAAPNQIVLRASEVIGTSYASSAIMSAEEIRQRIEFLVQESQLRARRAGVLNDSVQIGDGRINTYINFLENLKQSKQSLDLKAIVVEDTYTAGPLKIHLVAFENGKVVFSTLAG